MREHNRRFAKLWPALAASAVALLAAPPALAQAARPTAPAYEPTTADYLGVTDALQRYRFGVEKRDDEMLRSAFWEDAVNIAVPSPGVEINMPLVGGGGPPPGANGGPPAGFSGPPPGANGGPPAGFSGPPPGANGGPPPGFSGPPPGGLPPGGLPPGGAPPGGAPGGAPGQGSEVWHLPLDSYIHFESATRATHYGYFLSIYPEAERPREAGAAADMRSTRTSVVGWPGHYEDVLEKRNGEWRILSRKSFINQK